MHRIFTEITSQKLKNNEINKKDFRFQNIPERNIFLKGYMKEIRNSLRLRWIFPGTERYQNRVYNSIYPILYDMNEKNKYSSKVRYSYDNDMVNS